MSKVRGMWIGLAILLLAVNLRSQINILHSFAGQPIDGSSPCAALTTDGTSLYGTTTKGGTFDQGTIFKMNLDGSGFVVLYSFLGASPMKNGTLTLDGSVLYGLTESEIFSINTDGTGYLRLHSFTPATEGRSPAGSLLLIGSALYGVNEDGGVDSPLYGPNSAEGTIYKINTNGTGFTILIQWVGVPSPHSPARGPLAFDGVKIYGLKRRGGRNIVYSLFPGGSGYSSFYVGDSTLVNPIGPPNLNSPAIYAMSEGGLNASGAGPYPGTVFRVDNSSLGYEQLHAFDAAGDGNSPLGPLYLSGSYLYGMTSRGGSGDLGTLFQLNADGTRYELLHSFLGGALDGMRPQGSVISNGTLLYGMSPGGGLNGLGVVFSYYLVPPDQPIVTTGTVIHIGSSTAISGGNVTYEGTSAVLARGVCWNTIGSPTVADDRTFDGGGAGVFESPIVGLVPNTRYILRAYATNYTATSYGSEVIFTTTAVLALTISGTVTDGTNPIPGVAISFSHDGHVETTDAAGHYAYAVPAGTTTTITPSKAGYGPWTPGSRTLTNISIDMPSQDYVGANSVLAIAGQITYGGIPLPGAMVSLSPGGMTATTDSNGIYSLTVNYGWTGSATPFKKNFTFAPPSRSYVNVVANQTGQDYSASATVTSLEILNPSMESGTTVPDHWTTYDNDLTPQAGWANDVAHKGNRSLKIVNASQKNIGWSGDTVMVLGPYPKTLVLGGWSKADSAGSGGLYALDFYVEFEDGSFDWVVGGLQFSRGTHDWEDKEQMFTFAKGVRAIRPYALFYGTTGTVWFDDIYAYVNLSFVHSGSWSGAGKGADGWNCGDFNGDGKTDIFRYVPGVSGADVFLSDGAQFVYAGSWSGAGDGADGWHIGDFNGDGKDDILRYLPGIGSQVFLSNGMQFVDAGIWTGAGNGRDGWRIGDFNGDGKADLLRYTAGGGSEVFLSDGTKFNYAGLWTAAAVGADGWHVGDFNGDGKDDIMRYTPGTGAEVFLSDGTQFVSAGTWTPATNGTDGWYVGDFNGDGKDDIMRYTAGVGSEAFISDGTQFISAGIWSLAANGPDGWYLGDFNGDGRCDIFRYVPGTSGADVFLAGESSGAVAATVDVGTRDDSVPADALMSAGDGGGNSLPEPALRRLFARLGGIK